MLRSEAVSGLDAHEALKEPWRELVCESSSATPFQTWEWQTAWWRHFGARKQPLLFTAYDGNDLVGLMPLCVAGGLWRALRAAGGGPSDYLHPLSRPGYETEVAQALADFCRDYKRADLVDLHQVREDRAHSLAHYADQRLEQARCLVLDLPKSYDGYLASLSKSLRFDARRLDKDLFKSGRAKLVEFREDDLHIGLQWLFATHRQRWRKRGLPGAFLGKQERFHRDWATQAVKNGWLWLAGLTLDERPVGAIYAMRLGRTCYYYQAGFDPAHANISPGTLLVAHTIRRAIAEGLSTFDFLRGDEPYKRRWKPQRVLSNLRLLKALTHAGRVGLRWNGMGGRVESRVRARLEGHGVV